MKKDINKQVLEIYSKNSIYLDTSINTVYISGKRIFLNSFETKIMEHLIRCDTYVSKKDLILHLNTSLKEKCLVMIISRLKRKIKYTTGYTIIKNRYKKGYYIDS
ncbi:MAG: hypothetical protein RBT33_03595 [Candidatus Dojkabacteria bacterium]|nr:hypothetical protein [Candidatus Dojkabacteria bacterium]